MLPVLLDSLLEHFVVHITEDVAAVESPCETVSTWSSSEEFLLSTSMKLNEYIDQLISMN